MNSRIPSRIFSLLTVSLFAAGCASTAPKPPKTGPSYSYIVKMGDGWTDTDEFQVDVVPVSTPDAAILSVGVDDYFANKGRVRDGISKLSTKVLKKSASEFRVELEEPANKAYRYPGFSHIVIIADSRVRELGGKDRRRIALPLDPLQWQKDWPTKKREITVRFSSAGVDVSPGPIAK